MEARSRPGEDSLRPKGINPLSFKRLTCALSVALVVGATGMTASAMAGTLVGAGSTLVAPLENEWASGFANSTGNTVQYSAVGSGTGIKDISAGLVDFGASDAPMTSTQASGCDSGSCVTIPWALSATGLGYNIGGVGQGLKLTGHVIADIFLGKITNWDSSAIKKLNKGLKLPNLAITPVERSDGSGDTYAFTNYLEDVYPAATATLGPYATTVSWPAGVAKSGNAGVATEIAATNGAIGYVSASYLIAQKLDVAAVQNAKGNYEYPNINNIAAAAAHVTSIPSGGIHIVDPPKSEKIAYPISTFTNVIVDAAPKQESLVKSFIQYALTTGRKDGLGIDFAPIPTKIQSASLALLNSLS
jgi:phosphate transport system substrate-binding protein